MRELVERVFDPALQHHERAQAARTLHRLAASQAHRLDEEVRAAVKVRLPRERPRA